MRPLPRLAGLTLLALAALGLALSVGSVALSPAQVARALWLDDGSIPARILHELRLPRALSAFAIGALLALAGALIQVLLRNPLGDPYVLGVSGGASLAVLLGMLLGLPLEWQPSAAFAGALASMLLLALLVHGRAWATDRLLLTGVLLASGWSALISFVLSLGPPGQLPGMLFWLMGDLSDALHPALSWSALALGLGLALLLAPSLNVAGRGVLRARALGVEPGPLHAKIYFLSSGLTAVAVSQAGAIGFVGLVAPHLARLLLGTDHRWLLPGAALTGGSLLLLADTAARTLIAPMQLPVGVFTALLGVPLFLYLLGRTPAPPP